MYHVRTVVQHKDEPHLTVEFDFCYQPSEGDVERAQNAAVAAFWHFYGDDQSCSVSTTLVTGETAIDTLTGVLR